MCSINISMGFYYSTIQKLLGNSPNGLIISMVSEEKKVIIKLPTTMINFNLIILKLKMHNFINLFNDEFTYIVLIDDDKKILKHFLYLITIINNNNYLIISSIIKIQISKNSFNGIYYDLVWGVAANTPTCQTTSPYPCKSFLTPGSFETDTNQTNNKLNNKFKIFVDIDPIIFLGSGQIY